MACSQPQEGHRQAQQCQRRTHSISLPSSRRRSGLGKTRHGYQKEHRVSAVSHHTHRAVVPPMPPIPRAWVERSPRQHPCTSQHGQQGGSTPQHEGLDTNLANRALAKASLILQPPENSLRREDAERGYCPTQNHSVFAHLQDPCSSPMALLALLSPRGSSSLQRFQAQHKICGPAGRWQETTGTPRAGAHIGWARIDPCSSLQLQQCLGAHLEHLHSPITASVPKVWKLTWLSVVASLH